MICKTAKLQTIENNFDTFALALVWTLRLLMRLTASHKSIVSAEFAVRYARVMLVCAVHEPVLC